KRDRRFTPETESRCRRKAQQGLVLQKLSKGLIAELAAVSGMLVASEWHVQVEPSIVQTDVTGADLRGYVSGVRNVLAVDISAETIFSIVGNFYCFLFSIVANDTEHGTEDFLA